MDHRHHYRQTLAGDKHLLSSRLFAITAWIRIAIRRIRRCLIRPLRVLRLLVCPLLIRPLWGRAIWKLRVLRGLAAIGWWIWICLRDVRIVITVGLSLILSPSRLVHRNTLPVLWNRRLLGRLRIGIEGSLNKYSRRIPSPLSPKWAPALYFASNVVDQVLFDLTGLVAVKLKLRHAVSPIEREYTGRHQNCARDHDETETSRIRSDRSHRCRCRVQRCLDQAIFGCLFPSRSSHRHAPPLVRNRTPLLR